MQTILFSAGNFQKADHFSTQPCYILRMGTQENLIHLIVIIYCNDLKSFLKFSVPDQPALIFKIILQINACPHQIDDIEAIIDFKIIIATDSALFKGIGEIFLCDFIITKVKKEYTQIV